MTDIENYHNWLRDAHAMEKQADAYGHHQTPR
jgi:ferritin-like metal-binding protein YciE